MTSWNRRVEAATHRPAVAARHEPFSREEILREAAELSVTHDDQEALLALARVAAEHEGYRTTLVVRGGPDGERQLLFEVAYAERGAIARHVVTPPAPDATAPPPPPPPPPRPGGTETGATDAIDVVEVLTHTLVETPDLVAVFSSVGHEALWANDAFATIIPIREADKIWLVELLDEWSKGHYEVKVLPALVKFGRWRGRLTLLTGADKPMPVSAVIVAHRDHRGDIVSVSVVARDLGELRQADERVMASETRFAALVENASDLIAVLSTDGRVEYASPATTRLLAREDGSLEGANLLELVHPDDVPGDLLALAQPDEQGIGSPVELRLRADDGSWRHLEVVVSDLTDNPVIGGVVLNARDVTDRVEAVHALAAKAYTDALTGLPNRVRLLDRLGQALLDGEGQVGLILCDLDHFKAVNDAYGKEFADLLLQELAHRIGEVVGDRATLGRLRSDEFMVLLPGLDDPADVVRLANKVRAAVSRPFAHGGDRTSITASLGIAFSAAGRDPEVVLAEADEALAHAKSVGRDRSEVFNADLHDQTSRRRTVEQQLRHALDHDGLRVFYQPIIDIASGEVVAAESLLRVHDDDGGLLSPAEFVEAAESSGLIARLGAQVLQATCEQLASWGARSAGPTRGTLREISVNVSPRQLADPELPSQVLHALNEAGVTPDRLCLEITESILIGHQSTVDASISYLRALGVKIGLDEFGAGQSSLAYLRRFDLDFVKIDRTLIAGLATDEQDTAIVRATVELAHNLGLIVVAVGVETSGQLEALQVLGCDRAQGYLYAPPLSPDDFARHRSEAFG